MRCNALIVLLLMPVFIFSVGCSRTAEMQDRRDERDSYIQRGDARERVGDIEGAIEYYHKALERRPNLALAHLKLALEYDSPEKGEYLRAIHHYHRYLELRPHAGKREMIEKMIQDAHLSYLASIPRPPAGAIERIAMLEKEKANLKQRLERLESERMDAPDGAASDRRRNGSDRGSAVSAMPSASPRDEVETYMIRPGDSLSSIAARKYNDPQQWRRIYDANRETLPSPDSVRVGQTLIIPRDQ